VGFALEGPEWKGGDKKHVNGCPFDVKVNEWRYLVVEGKGG
jgi:hypothetical protein